MMAIIAMLSDIPMYVAQIISKLTGMDTSVIADLFGGAFAKMIEFAETILG